MFGACAGLCGPVLGLCGEGFGLGREGLGGVVWGLRVGQVGFVEWGGGFLRSEGCVRTWGVMFTGLRGCLGLVRAFAVRVWGLGARAKARNDSTQTAQKCYFGFGLVWAGEQRHATTERKWNGTGKNVTARQETARHQTARHGTGRNGTARHDKRHGKTWPRPHTRPGQERT